MRVGIVALVVLSALGASAERAVWVEFTGSPAVEAYAEARDAGEKAAARAKGRTQLDKNRAEQAAGIEGFKRGRADVKELFRVQRVANGVALRVPEEAVAALEALPGVKRVTPLSVVTIGNATSVPYLGAPQVWEGLPGATGAGVTIGVVDTGIDYLHPDFGGEGGAYASNDGTVLGDVPFPTAKVLGGLDFVGDAYDLFDAAHNVPVPDPDPMDQNGHGTHVAGTAAGFGVTGGHGTYRGPYNSDIAFTQLDIGPGGAPEAGLYALKIFGKGGSSEVLLPAFEFAVDPNGDGDFSDHLDVLNLSLGQEFGTADSDVAEGAANAARAGVLVVAAAGNDGETFGVVSAPGSLPSAISVAACEHASALNTNLVPDHLAGFSSRGPGIRAFDQVIPKPDLAAPGVGIVSAALGPPTLGNDRRTLNGTSMATPHAAGAAALAVQLHPDWTPAEIKALMMNTASPTVFVYKSTGGGSWPAPPTSGGAGRLALAEWNAARVIAYADEELVSASFGALDVDFPQTMEFTREIHLKNFGESAATYATTLAPLEAVPGVTVSLNTAAVNVPAQGTASVTLRLKIDASKLEQPRERTAAAKYGAYYRHFLTEVMGSVRFTAQEEGPDLGVPYYAVVRPVGAVVPGVSALVEGKMPATLPLEGTRVAVAGAHPVNAQVSPLELLYRSPALDVEPHAQIADLQYVGVALSLNADGTLPADPYLTFGFATWGDWMTPNSLRILVFIDTNDDGEIDFTLRNGFTTGNAGGPPYRDAFSSELLNAEGTLIAVQLANGYLPDGPSTAPGQNTALLRSNIMTLPLHLADLRLPETQDHIRFVVETVIDPLATSSGLHFVDAAPEQDFSGGISRWLRCSVRRAGLGFPRAGGAVPLPVTRPSAEPLALHFNGVAYALNGVYDATGTQMSGPLGALLLQHHNGGAAARAQWIPLLTLGDIDHDGIRDQVEGLDDADGGGTPNYLDLDSDGDGIADADEGDADADGDGTPNYLDLDSDGDGLSDAAEHDGARSDPFKADTDGDGIRDELEGLGDADGDGIANARDLDSDGDGIPDAAESPQDLDHDGLGNFLDLDSDGDGQTDAEEGTGDADGDGVPNYRDLDSDNDGLGDARERALGTNVLVADSDGDGVADGAEVDAGRDPLVSEAPATPAAPQVTTVDCTLVISWPEAAGAVEYRVLRLLVPEAGGPDAALAEPVSDWAAARTYTDATAQPSIRASWFSCNYQRPKTYTYAYFIEARNAAGSSAPGAPVLAALYCP